MIKKIQTKGMSWKFNAACMIGTTGVLGAQLAMGALNPVVSGLMLGSLGLYLWKAYKVAHKDEASAKADALKQPSALTAEEEKAAAEKAALDAAEEKKKPENKVPKWFNVAWGVAGLAGLIGAATFTIPSAVAFGTAAGISTAVVGALAVAVGTSLPELMVNVKSALKGDTDMAVGNILGSNVFNVAGIMGLVGLSGMTVPVEFNPFKSALGALNMAGFALSATFCTAAMAANKGTITKRQGALWVGLYAAYAVANYLIGGAMPAPGAEAAAAPAAAPVVASPVPVLKPPGM
jgi:Ca2+/Na+ antiporter